MSGRGRIQQAVKQDPPCRVWAQKLTVAVGQMQTSVAHAACVLGVVYLPVLAKKHGALRNGGPFQDWELA